MLEFNDLPSLQPDSGSQIILVEASSGLARTRYLRDWLASDRRDGVWSWLLPCNADFGGPWAGVKDLFRALVQEIEQQAPELLQAHGRELLQVLPTLRRKLPGTPLSLTDISVVEEKVRNYPMDRAYRNVHGMVDLLAEWQKLAGRRIWTLVCDCYDQAGALGGRFFLELARRRGVELNLTLVLVGNVGSFDGFSEGFPGTSIARIRPSLPELVDESPSPKEMGERARQLEERIGQDSLEEAENLSELVYYWLRSETPDKALLYQCFAFAEYNHQGFYEDALPYGEVVLQHLDDLADNTIFTRWNLVGGLCNCHLALRKPERALEIVECEAVGKIEDVTDRVRICYVLALIHSRFLPDPDFQKAEDYLTKGLELLAGEEVPMDQRLFLKVFTLNGLAFIRFRQKKTEEALELCRSGFDELTQELPSSQHRLHRSVLLYNTGQVYATVKSYDDALSYFTQAIEMDPNYSEYYNERGNVYLEIGRLSEAIADYYEAIRLSPPYYEVWTNLGQALKLAGRLDEALEAYSRALDIDPNQILPRVGRAQAYEVRGELQNALLDYSVALDLEPEQPLVLANRASIYFELGQPNASLTDLDKALLLDPENPGFYFNRSVALERLSRPWDAVRDLRTYLRLSPEADDRVDVETTILALTKGEPIDSMAV